MEGRSHAFLSRCPLPIPAPIASLLHVSFLNHLTRPPLRQKIQSSSWPPKHTCFLSDGSTHSTAAIPFHFYSNHAVCSQLFSLLQFMQSRGRRRVLDKTTSHLYQIQMCQLTRRRRLRVRRLRCSWPGKTQATLSGDTQTDENSSSDQSPTLVSSPDCLSETELVLYPAGDKEKESDSPSLVYSSVSITGRRREMEDEVSVELKFATKHGAKFDFFAVYDGHGGAEIAHICKERLHRVVAEEIEREKGEQVEWERMMEKCFRRMDEEVIDGPAAMKTVGSTAVLAVVGPEEVVVANCGDCRAVLGRNGVSLALSNDHKPGRADEMERIEAAGGKVINWNGCRVLGVLATSRSIGDEYLKPFVISKPEVTVTKRTDKDEFLILGSDGLWDVVSNDLACQMVRRVLGGHRRKTMPNGRLAVDATAALAELAIGKGSGDNISVIVVELQKPSNFSSL